MKFTFLAPHISQGPELYTENKRRASHSLTDLKVNNGRQNKYIYAHYAHTSIYEIITMMWNRN